MGKNRPPKKVRELLVQLERSRVELVSLEGQDVSDILAQLDKLIACKPEEYENFEVEAPEVLQLCALTKPSTKLAHSAEDGALISPSELESWEQEMWSNVCKVRTEMHANLVVEEASGQPVVSASTWRQNRKAKDAQVSQVEVHRNQSLSVPIVPRVSLAFADAATAKQKQFAAPELPRFASCKPARVTPAQQQTGGTIVWIRHFDLRIYDNPALLYAASQEGPVHLVFVWSDAEDFAQGKWRSGGTAASLWLYHALAALDSNYHRWYGHRINFVSGKTTLAALQCVVQETGSREIVTSKAYDNAGYITEEHVGNCMQSEHVRFQSFNSFLLNDVEGIRIDMKEHRGHFGTLVPFLFACNKQPQPPKPQDAPATVPKAETDGLACNIGLGALGLCRLPIRKDGSVLDWTAPILKAWEITEEAGYSALRAFLAQGGGLSKYEADRHLADASAVARISPYLRFGMLSCRTVYWEASAKNAKEVATTFWRRLVWRDLAYWQLRLFPDMAEHPIRDHYAGQKWNTDKKALDRWCQGRTGYPLVDAGMRELWQTGWMHQNVRMVVAIFLVEYLNIHWVEGARWFHHTLVDADPAINPMMWQNAGKSGLDQWNFTMHPAEFGRRVDPSGNYVRRWCPELCSLPPRFIHCPWEAPDRLQKHIPLGIYPARLVENLEAAALLSISVIRDQRARRKDRNDDRGYDTIVLPKGSTIADDGRRVPLFTKRDYRLPLKARMYDDERIASSGQYEKRRPDGQQAVLGDYMNARR